MTAKILYLWHPLTVTFCVQQQAYKLSSSLSECTTLPKLSRTLLNPLVSFDQSIHCYSATFLVNCEFGAVQDWILSAYFKRFWTQPWHFQSSTGSTISLSLDFLGAAQVKMRSETHFCFPESFQFPLGNLFLLAPNTICKKI